MERLVFLELLLETVFEYIGFKASTLWYNTHKEKPPIALKVTFRKEAQ